MEKATVAGGCFWCIEAAFLDEWGVESVQSGYVGERESVEILFDPQKITFPQLLDHFLRQIDPFDEGGQFADRGAHYQTAIFYHDHLQKIVAEKSKDLAERALGGKIATQVLPISPFNLAEDFHQKFCRTNPQHFSRFQSGHLSHLRDLWGKVRPLFDDPKEFLTQLQYHVTLEEGTEPPFQNAYWDNHREGIYRDILSGEPLFDSRAKFDSGTGWPSFFEPIDPGALHLQDDWKLGSLRTEVRSRSSNAHLGHLFPDGPPPTGLRYCMNSAAFKFTSN